MFASLAGTSIGDLSAILGEPKTVRTSGDGEWRMYDLESGSLRLRVVASSDPQVGGRVASWTLTLSVPAGSLREATEPLGLWPAVSPDVKAADVKQPLIRRPLSIEGASVRGVHTLTATVRYGAITQVSAFDEAPDWL